MLCYYLPAYYSARSALRARAIQGSLNRHVREKNTQAFYMKRLRMEDKLMFGKLLETSKEKKKRLKLEKKDIVPAVSTSNVDSEISWAQNNVRTKLISLANRRNVKDNIAVSRTILIKRRKADTVDRLKDDDKISNSTTVGESAESVLISDTPDSVPLKDQGVNQNVPTRKTDELEENSNLQTVSTPEYSPQKNKRRMTVIHKTLSLPNIVINHMTSFPIFDYNEKSITEENDSSNIISISQYENKTDLIFPSVTRILSATMSKHAKLLLKLWKERMIQKLGEEGFAIYQKELLENGNLLHSSIQHALTGTRFEVPERVKPSFDSVQNVLKAVTNVKAVETHTAHPKLHYRGIVDCVATYRGKLCVIDWKKSDKPKNTIGSMYDAPVQVASYIGALNSDKNYSFKIKHGLVVVAYSSGNKATVYELTPDKIQMYWGFWLKRLQQYYVELNENNIINENLH